MNRSKVHRGCPAPASFRTTTPSPCVGKLAFMKPVLGAEKVGDRCSIGRVPFSLTNWEETNKQRWRENLPIKEILRDISNPSPLSRRSRFLWLQGGNGGLWQDVYDLCSQVHQYPGHSITWELGLQPRMWSRAPVAAGWLLLGPHHFRVLAFYLPREQVCRATHSDPLSFSSSSFWFLFNIFFLSLCLRASSVSTHILLFYHFLIIRPPETWILLSLWTDYQIRQAACLYRSSDLAMTGNENGGIKTQLMLESGHVVCLYLSVTPINTHYEKK